MSGLQKEREPDVADIIAGALQTSRAFAYELMERALDARSTPQAAPQEAPAERALNAVLQVVRDYLPTGGLSKDEAMRRIIAIVDPWPLAAAPQGAPEWKLVPVIATPEMLRAHSWNTDGLDDMSARRDWELMLAAAPAAPQGAQDAE